MNLKGKLEMGMGFGFIPFSARNHAECLKEVTELQIKISLEMLSLRNQFRIFGNLNHLFTSLAKNILNYRVSQKTVKKFLKSSTTLKSNKSIIYFLYVA